MIERVRSRGVSDRSELESKLEIDRDALDTCLVEQPGLFHAVADTVITANSKRDALKMQLEEVTAQLDQDIREQAVAQERKLTEASIQNELRTMPRIQGLRKELLEASTEADRAMALKEAYSQRSYMLRELVAIQLAEFYNLGVERGAASARRDLGTQARAREESARREKRLGR